MERHCETFADLRRVAKEDERGTRLRPLYRVNRSTDSRCGLVKVSFVHAQSLDKSSAAQSLDVERLMGSLHVPAPICTADCAARAMLMPVAPAIRLHLNITRPCTSARSFGTVRA